MNPNWDVQKFDFDFAIAEERDKDTINALDPNLKGYIERGMEPDAARAAAQRKLGNTTLIREEVYRMNTLTFIAIRAIIARVRVSIDWCIRPPPNGCSFESVQ